MEEDGRTAMASVILRLSALCAKIQGLEEAGTDMSYRRVGMACICIAMHDLAGNAAAPLSSKSTTTRTTKYPTTPITTSRFAEGSSLGQGRRGYVTKVRYQTSGKTFAMKRLFPDPQEHAHGDEERRASAFNLRVLREACFMAACRGHPSLVCLYAVCRNPLTERYCLVMEHVGPSLHKVLTSQRRRRPFPEHEVRRMMRQILSGAKAMHDRGFVHRNIVPENVLVGGAGRDVIIKIGGYGQAMCKSEGDPSIRISSFSYMAPEVLFLARGAFKRELIDSWSIGCLMALLLTGRVLFEEAKKDQWGDEKAGKLRKIFDVCGVPDEETMEDIKPRDRRLAKLVRKWRAWRRRAGTLQRDSCLRELVPRDVLSDDGFEVLQGLLACNPRNRLTADAALQLPWLANDDDNLSPGAGAVSQQIVSAPVFSGQWPFAWLVASVLALLFLVVFVCVGGRTY